MEGRPVRIGADKLAAMLLITWLTTLVGLGNLIFLWKDKRFRKRAIIALGLSQGTGLIIIILSSFICIIGLIPLASFIPLGMAIWMTIDAINAYNIYRG
ncbi:MAG TPA: hypothetical protein ACFYD3_08460 [Candidatus Hypogeohydataceae bacterium YC41]